MRSVKASDKGYPFKTKREAMKKLDDITWKDPVQAPNWYIRPPSAALRKIRPDVKYIVAERERRKRYN